MAILLSADKQISNDRKSKPINKRLTPSDRFFKILLITSLYCKFKEIKEPTEILLLEFNNRYKIVHRVNALWIPATFADYLWRKVDTNDILNKVISGWISIGEAVASLKEAVPEVGHYPGMESDIERVLADSLEIA